LGERTIVKVDRALDDPHGTRRIRYRATVKGGEASGLFVSSGTQFVQPVGPDSVDLLVRALRVDDALGNEFPADAPPGEEDLLPNSLIQSDDDQIHRLAREIAADATSKWEIAVALERHVRDFIENKGFTQALSSAAEVIRSREGDCTEHAVLLAALCRAREIPSRVVIGLVYYRPAGGFAYHMWTEVWIEDRWLPLDATLGQGGIGAAHLAVSRSNLKGVDPLTQFLPVLQLIGNLKLEIVEVE
jgi:transglutaminase-like putative cysteine protease